MSGNVKTNGAVIVESELRAVYQCTEFHHLGGRIENKELQDTLQLTIEQLASESLRANRSELAQYQKYLRYSVFQKQKLHAVMLESQLQEHLRVCIYWLDQFISLMGNKIPIMGPLTSRTTVSKTPIEVRFSGLYKDNRVREQVTLEGILFSPYQSLQGIKYDPIVSLAHHLLNTAAKNYTGNPAAGAKLHVLGATKQGNVLHHLLTTNAKTTPTKVIVPAIKTLEQGIHFPILPCGYNCKFKQDCFPNDE